MTLPPVDIEKFLAEALANAEQQRIENVMLESLKPEEFSAALFEWRDNTGHASAVSLDLPSPPPTELTVRGENRVIVFERFTLEPSDMHIYRDRLHRFQLRIDGFGARQKRPRVTKHDDAADMLSFFDAICKI